MSLSPLCTASSGMTSCLFSPIPETKKIERIFAIATPTIVSLTRADNNTIQNMSDLNFYVFADEIDCQGADITSRCGMIAIMETLLYKRLSADSSTIIV